MSLPSDSLQIPPTYLKRIRDIITGFFPDSVVWAYGSRVNGKAHEGSDLDLVIRFNGEQKQLSQDAEKTP